MTSGLASHRVAQLSLIYFYSNSRTREVHLTFLTDSQFPIPHSQKPRMMYLTKREKRYKSSFVRARQCRAPTRCSVLLLLEDV
jgi:hypothetical protein